MHIRPEQHGDEQRIRAVLTSAFDTPAEANLVDQLRASAAPLLSLVALENSTVVGHLMCSPATCDAFPELRLLGLAPMAVAPQHQRKGIGSALVKEAIEHARSMDYDAIIVLGHPTYYPRFGFLPASRFDIRSTYEAPDEAFMALELNEGALAEATGIVRYHPVFDTLDEQH